VNRNIIIIIIIFFNIKLTNATMCTIIEIHKIDAYKNKYESILDMFNVQSI